MPEPLDLYGFWRSQATFRVRVALNLKGVPYREIPVDLDAGEQNGDAFRAIAPSGAVPALMVDGKALAQSVAILEYVEETYREPPLLPADPLGRARVRSLVGLAVSDAHPLIVPRIKRYLVEQEGFDPARWKAWQTRWFTTALQGIETRLAREEETGLFSHGDDPGLADICLVGLRAGAETFEIAVDGIPTVERIVHRCRDMAAFTDAAASRQKDFPG